MVGDRKLKILVDFHSRVCDTYEGEFLTREQALVRAVETGQVDMKKKPGNPTQLFSEDLY